MSLSLRKWYPKGLLVHDSALGAAGSVTPFSRKLFWYGYDSCGHNGYTGNCGFESSSNDNKYYNNNSGFGLFGRKLSMESHSNEGHNSGFVGSSHNNDNKESGRSSNSKNNNKGSGRSSSNKKQHQQYGPQHQEQQQ